MAVKQTAERLAPLLVEGPADLLEEALLRCARCPALAFGEPAGRVRGDAPVSPAEALLVNIRRVADNAQLPLRPVPVEALTSGPEEIARFIDSFARRRAALQREAENAQEELQQQQNLLSHLRGVSGLRVRLEELFACKYLRVRFGRLPADSASKLGFYSEHVFLFFPLSTTETYCQGVVLTTNEFVREVDNILDALYFERVRIPGDLCGTPAEAAEVLSRRCLETEARARLLREELRRLLCEDAARLSRYYGEAQLLSRIERARGYAEVYSGRFYLSALAGRDALPAVRAALASLDGVTAELALRTNGGVSEKPWQLKK